MMKIKLMMRSQVRYDNVISILSNAIEYDSDATWRKNSVNTMSSRVCMANAKREMRNVCMSRRKIVAECLLSRNL